MRELRVDGRTGGLTPRRSPAAYNSGANHRILGHIHPTGRHGVPQRSDPTARGNLDGRGRGPGQFLPDRPGYDPGAGSLLNVVNTCPVSCKPANPVGRPDQSADRHNRWMSPSIS
jgi:hypothetical protein